MKAKREARVPGKRQSGDRGGGRDGSVARTTRRTPADASRRGRAGKKKAPNREARIPMSGPQTTPMPRPAERPARPKNTGQAKARAKARKANAPKVVRPKLTERMAVRLASMDLRPHALLSRVPFVVLVIGSLGVGLGLTLWLSTDAAERSYQLSHARERTRMLQQQKESLERDVREAESAPALAEAARKQGMIPTRDTAHLVQAPDGNWVVVGTPKPADGVPPPPLNSKLPEEGPPAPSKPAALPPEVPVRVMPGPDDPALLPRTGPQLLPRTPDGSSTLGAGTNHLPGQPPIEIPGQVPGAPGRCRFPASCLALRVRSPGRASCQDRRPGRSKFPRLRSCCPHQCPLRCPLRCRSRCQRSRRRPSRSSPWPADPTGCAGAGDGRASGGSSGGGTGAGASASGSG
ncbi:putative conserved proline rich membrane protein [Mycobacterium ulcerans str. Harvey]|uniref:Conserved proline rich membrane protein n=1 Tax=Mycobacterium ulcerans str. Harvey TaxID=1299332 RepID=A0ABN0QSY6_MYCUL|nr:putative conserved proline rich membrane protein [Mycobacterium ulcerans str. Harvey]